MEKMPRIFGGKRVMIPDFYKVKCRRDTEGETDKKKIYVKAALKLLV